MTLEESEVDRVRVEVDHFEPRPSRQDVREEHRIALPTPRNIEVLQIRQSTAGAEVVARFAWVDVVVAMIAKAVRDVGADPAELKVAVLQDDNVGCVEAE